MTKERFEWLTEEICKEYLERARKLPQNDGSDTGTWRSLRIELQKRCNITETQAYNILRGVHIRDYLLMYGIKSGRIPMPEKLKEKLEREKEKEKKSRAKDDALLEYIEKIQELKSMQMGYANGSDYDIEEDDSDEDE